jgi:GntR family transcriptional regulator
MNIEQTQFHPNRNDSTPMYLQVANRLAEGVVSGKWHLNEAIPSERKLAGELAISRVTARKAISVLCERGILARKRGSGTYVVPKFEQALMRLSNFSEELQRRGLKPGSRWISRSVDIADHEEILTLGLSPNAVVARLRRLRTADGVALAIESSTIPIQFLPDPHAVHDTLYGYLGGKNLLPVRALQHIRAMNATAEQAKLLGIERYAAVLHVTRVGYLESGARIELTHSYCRSEYYDFVAELRK